MARRIQRDAVIKRSSESRSDRAEKSRESETREISDDERLDMLRQSMFQSSLPDLPKKEGMHRCWLTTTNPRDSVPMRERLGYRLLREADVPGFEFAVTKGGQYDGCIMVNEMIAAELPTRLFERYMANNHHQEPLFQEEAIAAKQKQHQEEAAQYGASLIEMPGNVALGKDPGLKPFSPAYGED